MISYQMIIEANEQQIKKMEMMLKDTEIFLKKMKSQLQEIKERGIINESRI